MIWWIVAIVAAWIACAVGAAGLWIAYFQGEFPTVAVRYYREDLHAGLVTGLLGGPIALAVNLAKGGTVHGWHLRRKP